MGRETTPDAALAPALSTATLVTLRRQPGPKLQSATRNDVTSVRTGLADFAIDLMRLGGTCLAWNLTGRA